MVMNSFGNRNFMQPMGGLNMHSKCLVFFFFHLSFGLGEVGGFFSFFLCSQHVLFKFPMDSIRFPMCSSKVFPIAPPLNPICFAQSPPLLTYMGGPNGEALHLSIESFILGNLDSFNFFGDGPIKMVYCPKKRFGCEALPTT